MTMDFLYRPNIMSAGVYRSCMVYKNEKFSPRRTVDVFEIELPLEQQGVSFIDGKRYPVRTDNIICARPGQIRFSRLPYSCRYLHLQTEDPALSRAISSLPLFVPIEDAEEYHKKFERIAALYESQKEEDALLQSSLVLHLIYDLKQEACRTDERGGREGRRAVEQIKAYIREDITRDFSLETMARLVGFSPSYLHSLFLKSTGMTLRAYAEDIRIRHAEEMLSVSSATLSQIALESGFGSQSYFSYIFKKRCGMTPRAYSKMVCERYPLILEGEKA